MKNYFHLCYNESEQLLPHFHQLCMSLQRTCIQKVIKITMRAQNSSGCFEILSFIAKSLFLFFLIRVEKFYVRHASFVRDKILYYFCKYSNILLFFIIIIHTKKGTCIIFSQDLFWYVYTVALLYGHLMYNLLNRIVLDNRYRQLDDVTCETKKPKNFIIYHKNSVSNKKYGRWQRSKQISTRHE